jgi:hypothetical protein
MIGENIKLEIDTGTVEALAIETDHVLEVETSHRLYAAFTISNLIFTAC